MAQVPNYYYNSPWIGEAARNLASALKPPDQDQLLARQAAQFNYQRAQTKAGYEDADRVRFQKADDFLGQLESMEPVVDEATGKIDIKATHQKARTLADAVLEAGGREYYTPVDKALGVASPLYAAQAATLKAKADAAAQRDLNRQGFTLNLQGMKEEGLNTRADAANTNRLDVQRLRNEGSLATVYERYKRRNASTNVKILPAATIKQLVQMLDAYEEDSGALMSQEDYAKMLDLAAAETLRTGNPAGAVVSVWEENAPSVADVAEGDSWINAALRAIGGNPTDPQLVPKFKGQPVAPGAAPLSSALDPGAQPAPARVAPVTPQADAAPDGVTIPIPVRTPEEAAMLPAGTLIVDPNGRVGRTKGRGP